MYAICKRINLITKCYCRCFQWTLFFTLLLMSLMQRGYSVEKNDFFNLSFPTYAKSNCSPSFPREFRGLKISMPLKINLTETEQIPLCGAFQISSKVEKKSEGKLIKSTVIVFANRETNETFSVNLIPNKEPVTQENISLPQSTAAVAEEYTVRQYFNIDVLYFSPDFPKKSASYAVYATVLDIKSNVIETQIIYEN